MGYDRRLHEVARNLSIEPQNTALRQHYESLLCRLYGQNCVEALLTIEGWDDSSIELQDAVFAHVLQQLGDSFEGLPAIEVTLTLETGNQKVRRIGRVLHKASSITLHMLPGGSFTLGSKSIFEASPPRDISIQPMLASDMPVLQSQWDLIGGHDQRKWTHQDLPIEGISFKDIQSWLANADSSFRLPSEAEWEFACKAGSASSFYWGDKMDDRYCWHKRNSGGKTHPPSKHKNFTNGFGLIDTLGNVYEMCSDRYFPDYHGSFPENGAPRGGTKGTYRVRRGGSWAGENEKCQSAYRAPYPRWKAVSTLGFRVFVDIPYFRRQSSE